MADLRTKLGGERSGGIRRHYGAFIIACLLVLVAVILASVPGCDDIERNRGSGSDVEIQPPYPDEDKDNMEPVESEDPFRRSDEE